MTTDRRIVGLRDYSGQARSKPQRLFERILEKCRIRAELCRIQAELDAELHTLNSLEIEELRQLIAAQATSHDADIAAMRRQISEEAELAKTVRPAQITISRKAVAAMAIEARKRIAQGTFPSTSLLASEAIQRAFA